MTEAEWKKTAFSQPEWTSQSERKKDCLWNSCEYLWTGYLCTVPDDKCKDCKAFGVMPMGLGSLVEGGFKGIMEMQMRHC